MASWEFPCLLYWSCNIERGRRYVTLSWLQNFWIEQTENSLKVLKFALFQTSSVLFNSNVSEIFSIEFERTVSEFRKRKQETFCVSFTYSVKRARKNRNFHVVVDQGWLKNVQKAWCRNVTSHFSSLLTTKNIIGYWNLSVKRWAFISVCIVFFLVPPMPLSLRSRKDSIRRTQSQ